jgi:P-type E1-E2 ATPase
VVVITLILLGKLFENRAKGETSEAIRKLIGLQAKTARVIREGNELDIPIEDVIIGDVGLVRPGEKIPVDGEAIAPIQLEVAMLRAELSEYGQFRGIDHPTYKPHGLVREMYND